MSYSCELDSMDQSFSFFQSKNRQIIAGTIKKFRIFIQDYSVTSNCLKPKSWFLIRWLLFIRNITKKKHFPDKYICKFSALHSMLLKMQKRPWLNFPFFNDSSNWKRQGQSSGFPPPQKYFFIEILKKWLRIMSCIWYLETTSL